MKIKHAEETVKKRGTRNFLSRVEHCALSESRDIFSFSLNLLRGSYAFRIWEKYMKYFRRFRFVTTAVRLFPWILLLISTHTLLYAVAAVAVVMIPLLLLVLISLATSAFIRYRDVNERMEKRLSGKTVYVFFPERTGEFSGAAFWRENIFDLASRDAVCVVVVSPFFLSPRGLLRRPFYFNMRTEAPHVFLVRRHYFYSLKKHVLPHCTKRLIFIY